MSTATKTSHAAADHIRTLERKIESARQAHTTLGQAEFYDQLLTIIHRPGWTTLPEQMLVELALESVTRQLQMLGDAQSQLLKAAQMVGQ